MKERWEVYVSGGKHQLEIESERDEHSVRIEAAGMIGVDVMKVSVAMIAYCNRKMDGKRVDGVVVPRRYSKESLANGRMFQLGNDWEVIPSGDGGWHVAKTVEKKGYVYESKDSENNITSRVYKKDNGAYSVRTIDGDSGQPIEIRNGYRSEDDAKRHANKMTGKGSETR